MSAVQKQPGPLRRTAETLRILREAGLVRLEPPQNVVRAVANLVRWGPTAAAGYATSAMRYPHEPAVVDELGTLRFSELHERTNAIADVLARRGIRAGDRVALMCRNHRGFIEGFTALSKLGVDVVLLNTAFAGPQCAEVIEREGAKMLIHDQEFAALDPTGGRDVPRVIAWRDEGDTAEGPTLDELAAEGSRADREPPSEKGRAIILTSGTTGAPKGAARPHPPTTSATDAIATVIDAIPLRVRERTLIAAPLFHSWGLAHLTLAHSLSATVVLRRRFDPEDVIATVARERCRTLVVVPVMLQRILELPEEVRRRYDTSSLEVVAASGSALPGELALRFMNEFGDVLYNLYGSTEVAWAAIAGPRDLRAAPGTAGRAPRGTSLKILDSAGRELPQGESGRIFVANDLLFEGYTSGGSKEMIAGLMSTGDVGRLDEEGRLFVEGRDDEMIVSGGENVFPSEVEDVLAKHPSIREAAAVGVPDDEFGQRLKAFVVLDGGNGLSEDDVKAYVRENLARYKVPRDVVFMDELPRNSTGKVLKRLLT